MTTLTRFTGSLRRLPIHWSTVALCALALALLDGFWLTALQGAIGAIERLESPFARWLRQSALMLPLFGLAVVAALMLARRWAARGRVGNLAAAVTVLVLFSAGAGLAVAIGSSIYDYSFQSEHLWIMHSYGANQQASALAGFGGAPSLSYQLYCNLRGVTVDNAVALLQYATLMTHVRALSYFGVFLLLINLPVVAALLAARRDRLWTANSTRSQLVAEPASPPAGAVATT
jgi:hypothetical protein